MTLLLSTVLLFFLLSLGYFSNDYDVKMCIYEDEEEIRQSVLLL